MKMKNIKIVYLITFVFLLSSCLTLKKDPDTDAVYKTITKVYQLNEDGSFVYQYKHRLKYITYYAFNRLYGESFIVYNPEFQEVKINLCETTMKDGKVVSSPENAFNEVLPRFAAGAPYFNHLRELVVTHTGLERKSVVDFDYELYSKPNYLPFVNERLIIGSYTPVHKFELIVKVADDVPFHYQLLNSTVEPKETLSDGFKVYKWVFEDIKGFAFDNNMPEKGTHVPQLLFSTVNYADAFKIFNIEDSLSNGMKKVVKDKISKFDNDFDKLFALQKMVDNDINDFEIPIEHANYSIRSLADIWKSNGATNIEKTILLSYLLNEAEIKSETVFAYPEELYNANIGIVKGLGKPMIKALVDDKDIYISALTSNKNNCLLMLDDKIILDLNGNIIEIKSVEEVENKLSFASSLSMNEEGIVSGQLKCEVSGFVYPYFDLLQDQKNAKKITSSFIPGEAIQKHKLVEWNENECKVNAKIKCEKFIKQQGDYYFISIPESSLGIQSSHLAVLTEKRSTPLELENSIEENYQIDIDLPDGFELVSSEIDSTIENKVGSLHLKISKVDNKLEIVRSLKINDEIIEPKDYNDFKLLYLNWIKGSWKEIIVKK